MKLWQELRKIKLWSTKITNHNAIKVESNWIVERTITTFFLIMPVYQRKGLATEMRKRRGDIIQQAIEFQTREAAIKYINN